jgi:crossover junction endodeoxyribonuclease RuvC
MRVLGIDPGTRVTGFGVAESARGSRLRWIADGVIAPPENAPLAERLHAIFEGLTVVIAEHRPDAVAVEDIFHHRSIRSALTLGHARGVALLAAARAGLPVHAYPPATVKQAVTGHGRAEKHQVSRMVQVLLGHTPERADSADALACALAHLLRAGSGSAGAHA